MKAEKVRHWILTCYRNAVVGKRFDPASGGVEPAGTYSDDRAESDIAKIFAGDRPAEVELVEDEEPHMVKALATAWGVPEEDVRSHEPFAPPGRLLNYLASVAVRRHWSLPLLDQQPEFDRRTGLFRTRRDRGIYVPIWSDAGLMTGFAFYGWNGRRLS